MMWSLTRTAVHGLFVFDGVTTDHARRIAYGRKVNLREDQFVFAIDEMVSKFRKAVDQSCNLSAVVRRVKLLTQFQLQQAAVDGDTQISSHRKNCILSFSIQEGFQGWLIVGLDDVGFIEFRVVHQNVLHAQQNLLVFVDNLFKDLQPKLGVLPRRFDSNDWDAVDFFPADDVFDLINMNIE